MDKFEELMARRQEMTTEWMRWVKANRSNSVQFFSAGVVLLRNGDLWMTGQTNSGHRVLELWSEPEKPVQVVLVDAQLIKP